MTATVFLEPFRVDWFNHRRLLEPIRYVPPAEFEAAYWSKEGSEEDSTLRDPSLR